MKLPGRDGGTFVGFARLRESRPAHARSRAAVELLADTLDGVHPEAILIVRSLRCRLPPAARPALHDLAAVRAAGVQARQRVSRLAEHAARPRGGGIAADADAVLFEDLAELIACLARDWLDGNAAAHWWWTTLLRLAPIEAAVLEYCRKNPQHLPAVLGHLAATSHAIAFARKLPPRETVDLACAMAAAYAVPHEITALLRTSSEPIARPESSPQVIRLRNCLPECIAPRLDVAPTVMLALGLGLHRTPSLIRSAAFVDFVRDTYVPREETAAPTDAIKTEERSVRPQAMHAATGALAPHRQEAPVLRTLEVHRAAASDAEHSHANSSSHVPMPPPANEVKTPALPKDRATTAIVRRAASGTRDSRDTVVSLQDREAPPAPLATTAECPTRFGGIFYVLNAALYLGLYGDFTQPRKPGIAMSPWDLLAACGRAWFGKRFVKDPVWRLLAQLAGRETNEAPDDSGLDALLPPLEARIALALGRRNAPRALALLVRVPARVRHTATRIDIHLALAELPLPVRYAGLDRDPGWIPASGRFVAFHFD